MTTKCLRHFYHKIDHQDLTIEQAFQEVDSVLRELYGIVHFSIFYNNHRSGYITSLYNSRDGIYGAGDRLLYVDRAWFDVVLNKGKIFSTANKLKIYDSFAKGLDFLVLGAESLVSIPVKHQQLVIGVANMTLPRHLICSEEAEMAEILTTMKPYIFDSECKFRRVMPGSDMDFVAL